MSEHTSDQHLNVHSIETGELHRKELFEIFGNQANLHSERRVVNENLQPHEQLAWLEEQVAAAKLAGRYVAMVPGGFDVPHDNHEWYLRHCRMLAAKQYLIESHQAVTIDSIRSVMNKDIVCLLVSIDSDEALHARKKNDPAKGGAPRPVYPWQSRAHRIAGYSYAFGGDKIPHFTADIISKECTITCKDTPLEDAASLSAHLHQLGLLDTILVYPEHPQDEANARKNNISPIVVPEFPYAVDPRTNIEYHSSSIIKSIRGE